MGPGKQSLIEFGVCDVTSQLNGKGSTSAYFVQVVGIKHSFYTSVTRSEKNQA